MAKKVIQKVLRLGGVELKRYDKSKNRYKSLFKKYRDFTMIPEQEFITNLELCDHFKNLKGDFVECGVWRGGMSAAIAEIIGAEHQVHLFDSFEGLPPAKTIDGKEAIAWQQNKTSPGYFDNCRAEERFALEAMKKSGHKKFRTHPGWFAETLPEFGPKPISILRLDGDWYDSIMTCLEQLFPRVIGGGIIILDDYYVWDGCAKAVHDYLSRIASPSRIHQWKDQIAYIIKKN